MRPKPTMPMVRPATSVSGVFQKHHSRRRPLALFDEVAVQLRLAIEIQQQGEHEFRHGIGGVDRNIRNRHTARPRRLDVHDIIAGGQHADEFQFGQFGKRVGR